MFVEREDGGFKLRRAFKIAPGAKVVVVEDVITTGGSFREAVEPVEAAGGVILGCACIVDRSGGRAEVGWPLVALATLDRSAEHTSELQSLMRTSYAVLCLK